MATLLEQLKASSAWDARFNLPTFPEFNNPWIYMAYAQLVLELGGEELDPARVLAHFYRCETDAGLFYRWPDHGGGQTSHDEIMGAASLHPTIASRILSYLDTHDGEFNVTGEPETMPEEFNVYRMVFLRPYLAACAGDRVGLISQALWLLCIVLASFQNTEETDAGGRLRSWLMISRLGDAAHYPLAALGASFWRWRMRRAGFTLAGSLALEPGDYYPILSRLAPGPWETP